MTPNGRNLLTVQQIHVVIMPGELLCAGRIFPGTMLLMALMSCSSGSCSFLRSACTAILCGSLIDS